MRNGIMDVLLRWKTIHSYIYMNAQKSKTGSRIVYNPLQLAEIK